MLLPPATAPATLRDDALPEPAQPGRGPGGRREDIPISTTSASHRSDPPPLEAAVQRQLRAGAARAPDAERVGPFLAGFDRHSDSPFRNWATPDDLAAPTPDEIVALVAAFDRRGRLPRVELVASAAPRVAPALLAAGFVEEGRTALLTCPPEAAAPAPPPDGVRLIRATDVDDLRAAAEVQHAAYGEPEPPTEHDVARLRGTVDRGGVVVIARDAASGAPVGAGLVTPPAGGLGELAAVATHEGYRRRGIAGAVTAELTRLAYAAGTRLVYLEAAGPAEQRVYQRVGFQPAGQKLSLRRAPG